MPLTTETGEALTTETGEPLFLEGEDVAAQIIKFDASKSPMSEVVAALRMIREGRRRLVAARDVMLRFRDGADNAGDPTNYVLLATECGFAAGGYATANAAARESFLELDSLLSKINSDAAVSAVLTAQDQACSKHGV